MPIIIIKNLLLVIMGVIIVWVKPLNAFETVMFYWSILSVLQLFFLVYIIIKEHIKHKSLFPRVNFLLFKEQYKKAFVNFSIGLIAVLSLQCDRLIVGLSLNEKLTGIYFRHASVIAILYQLFNIVSYNRLVPVVFKMVKDQAMINTIKILKKEYLRLVLIVGIGMLSMLFLYKIALKEYFSYFNLNINLLILLSIIFLIRVIADFKAMIFNGINQERIILYYQLFSLSVSTALMYFLIPRFEINGVLLSSFVGTILYSSLLLIKKINPKKIINK